MKKHSLITLIKLNAIASASMILSGCATAFTGTEADVTIKSTPAGADVYAAAIDNYDGIYLGKTPISAKVPKETRTLIVKKRGYEDLRISSGRKFAFFPIVLDIFCWPTFFVDAYTGACYDLTAEHDILLKKR